LELFFVSLFVGSMLEPACACGARLDDEEEDEDDHFLSYLFGALVVCGLDANFRFNLSEESWKTNKKLAKAIGKCFGFDRKHFKGHSEFQDAEHLLLEVVSAFLTTEKSHVTLGEAVKKANALLRAARRKRKREVPYVNGDGKRDPSYLVYETKHRQRSQRAIVDLDRAVEFGLVSFFELFGPALKDNNEAKLLKSYLVDGASFKELEPEFGVSDTTLSNRFQRICKRILGYMLARWPKTLTGLGTVELSIVYQYISCRTKTEIQVKGVCPDEIEERLKAAKKRILCNFLAFVAAPW
jgi:hypothetical protein